MNYFLSLILFALTLGAAPVQAQEFDRLYGKGIQPVLSQPLQWVSAPPSAAPGLPEAFAREPGAWAFSTYTAKTVLPTTPERDAWLKFTLAATPTPQSWIVRIPRVTVRKVSLYALDGDGLLPVQTAGLNVAPAAWSRTTRSPSFEVLTGSAEKTYFLRIENRTPMTERPELLSQSDFADGAARVGALIGLQMGTFGFLTLACIAAYALARNTVFLSLAIFVAAVLLYQLVGLGYGGWRLWPNSVHLNQATQWAAPLWALAAGCWFFAQASYAKDSHRRIYLVLLALATVSACLSVFMLVAVNPLPREFLNAWASGVVATLAMALVWLSWRGRRWNWWLAVGLLPLAGSAATRLIYNYGWLSHVEFAQSISALLTMLGLLLLFLVLAWRSRDALLSAERANALANSDPVSGLTHARVAKIRMQQMLLRADRLKLGCGVIMLRWNNVAKLMASQSTEQQDRLYKQFGQILSRLIRDIDTAAVLGDGHFMLLIEGPVNRSALSSLCTQIVSACIRASEKFDLPNAFQLHMAIWQAGVVPNTPAEVIDALQTRLGQMAPGTKRAVQFVDSMTSETGPEQEEDIAQRRDELVAKINAIEATPGLHMPTIRLSDKK